MKEEKEKENTRAYLHLFFVFSQKGTSLDEGPFMAECWLGEEQQLHLLEGVHRCTVFRGAIEGCTTIGGAIVGGAIFNSAILGRSMEGCFMVGGTIKGITIKGGTIVGSARLHPLWKDILCSAINGYAIVGCAGAGALELQVMAME